MNRRNSNGCIRCKSPRETPRPLHFPGARSAAADFLPGSRRIGTRAFGATKIRSNCRRAAITPLDGVGPPGQSPGVSLPGQFTGPGPPISSISGSPGFTPVARLMSTVTTHSTMPMPIRMPAILY